MKNIGILGCGYVGQACAAFWRAQGYTVSVTTRQACRVSFLEKLAHKVYLLDSSVSLKEFIKKQEAILISVAPTEKQDYTSTYLQTAKKLVEDFSLSYPLKQLIYTSSTSVYGDHQGAWVDETTPLIPSSPSSTILIETEQVLLRSFLPPVSVCVFRLGEIYGPGRTIEERLRGSNQKKFPGNGKSYTNLIHLRDIVRACDFALNHQLKGIYNLCNETHLLRHLFYDTLCTKNHLAFIQWDNQQTNTHAGNKRVSNQRLKNLGFKFEKKDFFEV